jgi:hypothetical protein
MPAYPYSSTDPRTYARYYIRTANQYATLHNTAWTRMEAGRVAQDMADYYGSSYTIFALPRRGELHEVPVEHVVPAPTSSQ